MWKLQIGLETLGRLGRGELFCVVCDEAIALAAPPFVGFIKADLGPELCGLAVCELCSKAAGTFKRLVEVVAEAVDGTGRRLRSTVSGSAVPRRFCGGARPAVLRRPS